MAVSRILKSLARTLTRLAGRLDYRADSKLVRSNLHRA